MKELIIFLLVVLFTINGHSQNLTDEFSQEQDLEFRSGFLILKKLKNFEFFWGEELRITPYFSRLDRGLSMLGSAYRINPYFKVSADFSHIIVNTQTAWENRYRNSVDLTLSYPINAQWRLSFRERLWTMINLNPNYYNLNKKTACAMRSRLMTEYTCWSSITLQTYFEVSNRISTPNPIRNYLDKVRFYVGAKYAIMKHSEFELFYRIDYNTDKTLFYHTSNVLSLNINKRTSHIVGLFYNFSFL
ncbi:MAG: DUF2490 domain-containing protein [Bacteroidales bacterium]